MRVMTALLYTTWLLALVAANLFIGNPARAAACVWAGVEHWRELFGLGPPPGSGGQSPP